MSPPGRRAEFESLYDRFHRSVWAVAYARRHDSELALDLMQEAFLRLWRAWEQGVEITSPQAWLIRVVRNLAEDDAKSAFTRNGTRPPESLAGLRDQRTGPTEGLERAERHAQVRSAVAGLSDLDREVLVLRYALDRDPPAIAETLGVSVASVHMRLSRARTRLAEQLKLLGVEST